jgi:autoinducer 2-degrading protein
MYIVAVTVHVLPDHVVEFIAATRENAENTRKEPHNLRFDVIQVLETPTQFMLYEVYESEDGFKAHQQTEHYLKWRERVAPWMAQPRSAIKCREAFPAERSRW